MQSFGAFVLLLALVAAAYGLLAGGLGLWLRRPRLLASGLRADLATFPLVTAAVISLWGLILRNDFAVAYVAEHSNRALPFYYKLPVLWSGQEGSLLFWSWILSGYAFIASLTSARRHPHLRGLAMTVLAGVQVFFLLLNNFAARPFATIPVAAPADGNGLNPLLQYAEMIFHPPMLYLGYIGFSVPFAFALAALIRRYPGDRWIHVTRRWTMIAWLFLSIGIVLGGLWAYTVLGWGGYWAWDPVENASFMPWLMGTAFLHSVMMQEKRGMLKKWNVWLIFGAFLLSIFGDFITRSGLIESVHAFAQSSIGNWFIVFLALLVAVCVIAFWRNRDFLDSPARLESTLARESGFLFNNFIFLVLVFAILWGTMFPVLSEWIQGQKITVGRAFFDRINVPVFLFLLLLTGVGPVLAWRRTSAASLRRNFLWPGAAGAGLFLGLWLAGIRNPYSDMAFALGLFVTIIIISEFLRGARVLARRGGISLARALPQLVMRNTRRYGGYIVHLGIVLLFIGIAGSGFNQSLQAAMPYQAHMRIGPYTLISESYTENDNPNYSSRSMIVQVDQGGQKVATLYPARRFYKASHQTESMVAIHTTALNDLYLVYGGRDPQTGQPILHAYLNPLMIWIWVGAIVLVLGTLIALMPSRMNPGAGPALTAAAQSAEAVEAHS